MSVGLQRWEADLVRFRRRIGFDFREPDGFSRYLIAAYSDHANEDDRRLFDSLQVRRDYGLSTVEYRKAFQTWFAAMAPRGMICARGLHSLAFSPGEDIAGSVLFGREGTYSSYSMNLSFAVVRFATAWVTEFYPTVTRSWANVASTIDRRASDTVGMQIRTTRDEEFDDPSWSSLPKKTRDAIIVSQCPVVLVSHLDMEDLVGPGGDSESGDVMEAEVLAKQCEPRCLRRVFVASALNRLGKPVSRDDVERFGLAYHRSVKGEADARPVDVLLHPSVRAGSRRRNLPSQWSWYDVTP